MARGFVLDKGRSREVLLALAALGADFIFPRGSKFLYSSIIRQMEGGEDPRERAFKARRLKELTQRRLVSIRDVGRDKVAVSLTSEGKKLVKLYEFNKISLPKPAKWDKRWRVITYDIPTKKQKASLALSAKFHQLGMFRLQKSIWVYPHDCKDDIDAICAVFQLNADNHILYLTCDKIPREAEARRHFDLALS